ISLIVDPDAGRHEPPPPPPSAEPWHFALGVSALGGGGVLPGAAFGGAIDVSIDAPALPVVELAATAWMPDETSSRGQGGRFGLVTAGIAARITIWKLDAGFGLQLGRMTGSGIGFDRDQNSTALIPAVVIDPAVTWSRPGISFTAGLSLWLTLVRPQF